MALLSKLASKTKYSHLKPYLIHSLSPGVEDKRHR